MLRTRIRAGPASGFVLSLGFAVILTLLQTGPRFLSAWSPEFGEHLPTTVRVPYGPRVARDESTGRAVLRYEHRRVIVPLGTRLRPDDEEHAIAYFYEHGHRPPSQARVAGLFVIFATLGMALTAYLRRFGQSRLKLLRVQLGILFAIVLMAVAAKLLLLLTSVPEFWIPCAAVPLWVATSFDRRTAFVVTVVLAFVIAAFLQFDLNLLCVMLAHGMSATLLFMDRKRVRQMVVAGALAGLCSAALMVAVVVTFEGTFDVVADLSRAGDSWLLACTGGGLLGGVLGAVAHVPAERLLGHVSRERLHDLSDLEQPLLQRLAQEAPGTFEHSRAMANLAEQAASAIGADALLTRVGAYYHDVGKSAQSKYFVENLGPDEDSPHDQLDPEVSADAIMAHVVIGTRMLREGRVPEPIVEFAYTHHGTQVVEYFWNKCLEQGNPKDLTPDDFRYPGMKPQTKETAILMLIDSIEAASRTIDPPERSRFEEMVQRIVFTKLRQGQLDECGLDLKEMRVVVTRVADTLVNMHHHRIKYQWQEKRAEEFGVPSRAFRDSMPQLEVRPASTLPPSFDQAAPSELPPAVRDESSSEERKYPPASGD